MQEQKHNTLVPPSDGQKKNFILKKKALSVD